MSASHGWVESPLQFLSALEARRPGERLILHTRTDATGMADFLARFDHSWLPAEVTLDRDGAGAEEALATGEGRLFIGDLCSGRFQRALTRLGTRLPSRLVLIDDGLATQHVVRQLTSNRPTPLSRPRQRLSAPRKALALATALRIRGALRSGQLTWTTALPVPEELEAQFTATGGILVRHTFAQLRSLPAPEQELPNTLVLGSAMAVDALIYRADYLEWVERVTAGKPAAYFAHRRETEEDLAAVAALPGVIVHTAGLPVELRLARAPQGSEIFSLPTSAVVTLPQTMDEPHCHVTEVPREWWTGNAPDSLRRELNQSAVAAGYTDNMSRYTVVSISDSESYLKWACRTLDALGPDVDTHVWLIDNPILPTPEQIKNATAGSSWAGRSIPVIKRSDLEAKFVDLSPDVVLAAATGPVVQQIYATGAHLERRPALVSGLPGVGLPATSKGMRYRRIGDAFVSHSRREREEYLAVAQKLRVPVELIVARLPLLSSTEPPAPRFEHRTVPERIVFATQAKVPVLRDDRVKILLSLAEYSRRHSGSEVIVKVRSRPGEQETHHEQFTYVSLLSELVADGLIGEDELTVAVGAMSQFLIPGTALVTVSSTAALESIDQGLQTLIINDFGVNQEMLNIAFEGSGITSSLADLIDGNLGYPAHEWLIKNYFQEPNTDLKDSFRLLAKRSRKQQLPDLRGAARIQDLRRLRAELRTMAPEPVVHGYRQLAKHVRAVARKLVEL